MSEKLEIEQENKIDYHSVPDSPQIAEEALKDRTTMVGGQLGTKEDYPKQKKEESREENEKKINDLKNKILTFFGRNPEQMTEKNRQKGLVRLEQLIKLNPSFNAEYERFKKEHPERIDAHIEALGKYEHPNWDGEKYIDVAKYAESVNS